MNAAVYSYLVTVLLTLVVVWFLTSRYYRWRIEQERSLRASCPTCRRPSDR